ncbi:MAG: SDR family NAD(P)-dependent oxidoreductase [Gammaproteobacteria bacterium]
MTIRDKVAVITGVSSGLGRECVKVFAAQGARVVGSARRAEAGAELEREVRAAGGQARFVACDLRRVEECDRLIDAAVDAYGRVDILINNAAARSNPPLLAFDRVDEANWDDVLDTNLKAAFFCARAAVRDMLKRGSGMIVNIASYTAVEAVAGMAPYAISKAGLIHMTRMLAVEYMDRGIKSNVIILGGVNTGQAARTQAAVDSFTAGAAGAAPVAPARRSSVPMYESAEVARTLALLCHDDARAITGGSIPIDYGVAAGLYTSLSLHQNFAAQARD